MFITHSISDVNYTLKPSPTYKKYVADDFEIMLQTLLKISMNESIILLNKLEDIVEKVETIACERDTVFSFVLFLNQTYTVVRYPWELGSFCKPARSAHAGLDYGP